ncbi:hypothetical protein C900_04436 [Fulvivirga imtechensis AK7]|uniref:Uncharacterized protein n=1 Tax=Fulvivirga imtechensis AK7 TaxID=1237149 RepID=L8JRK3_9BACT|nr:hypothetical protein C900_04436 [Fulvivirga imtechensis AK7]
MLLSVVAFFSATSYAQTRKVYINFNKDNPAASPWNNMNADPLAGTALVDLMDDQGQGTGIGITLVDSWTGVGTSGATTGSDSGVYPDNVLKSYYRVYQTSANLKVTGLIPNRNYTFRFLSSRNTDLNPYTDFTIGAQTVTTNAAYNTTTLGEIANVTSDANGEAIITVSNTPGYTQGYLNGMEVEYATSYDFKDGAVELSHTTSWCSDPAAYTTVGMTADGPAASCNANSPLNNVWFKFQATSNEVAVDLSGSGLTRASMTLWDASSNELACGIDHNYGEISLSSLSLTPGEWYYISVDNRLDNSVYRGNFSLCIKDQATYDFKERAVEVSHTTEWCSDAAAYTTLGMSPDGPAVSCNSFSPQNNAWFKFQATANEISIELNTPSGGLSHASMTLWDASFNELDCRIDHAGEYGKISLSSVSLTPGELYYISVDNNHTSSVYKGAFGLCIKDKASYDFVEGAIELPHTTQWCSDAAAYTTLGMTPDGPAVSCNSLSPQNNVWFKFQATANEIIIDLNTNSGGLSHASMTLWDASLNELECRIDYAGQYGKISLSTVSLIPGELYYLSVDNNHSSSVYKGSFGLCIDNTVPSFEWNFNACAGGTLTESINGMHGTVYGAQWTEGFSQQGLYLDGVDDYASIPDDPTNNFGGNNFTVAYWVKKMAPTNNNDNIMGVAKWNIGGESGTNEWLLNIGGQNSEYPHFNIESGTIKYKAISATPLTVGQWHHLAGVREGSQLKLYQDGVLVATTEVGSAVINNTNLPVYIGRMAAEGYNSHAVFDELKLYNYALSASEISNEAVAVSSPVSCNKEWAWNFNSCEGAVLTENVNGLNGVINGATWSGGYNDKGLSFDGINDYATLTGSEDDLSFIQNTGVFTISLFIKLKDLNARSVFLGSSGTTKYKGFGLMYETYGGSYGDHQLRFTSTIGEPGTVNLALGAQNTINDNNWHHVAVVGDGANIKFYVDGIQDGTETALQHYATGTSDYSVSLGQFVDNYGNLFLPYNGSLDELKIYNRTLDATEIAQLAQVPFNSVLCDRKDWSWNFNSCEGTVLSESVNGLNGTVTGATWTEGYNEQGLYLDGVDDYVSIPDDPTNDFGDNNFTIAYWVKKMAPTSNSDNVMGVAKWNIGSDVGTNEWVLNIGGTNSEYPQFNIESGDVKYKAISTTPLTVGQWHHLAGVREGSQLKLYQDGVLVATTEVGSAVINNTNLPVYIGRMAQAGYNSQAIFDELKIYNYALSDTEVGQLAGLILNPVGCTVIEPTTPTSNVFFSNVTEHSMEINWTNGDGSGRIVLMREWQTPTTTGLPKDGTEYSWNSDASLAPYIGANRVMYVGSGSGTTITGLDLNKYYGFAIFEFNGSGTNIDYLVSNRGSGGQYTAGAAPQPTVSSSSIEINSITETSAHISWVSGDGEKRLIIARVNQLPTSSGEPKDGWDYNFNADFSSAPGIGPNKIVYEGTGNEMTISGLLPNTKYGIKIFEFNGYDSLTNYMGSGAGAVFTTLTNGVVPDVNEITALRDLYETTGGATWTNTTGWPTDWSTITSVDQIAGWHGITALNGDVVFIDLNNNGLAGNLPVSLNDLQALQVLRLHQNSLTGGIPDIRDLKALEELHLSNNNLGGSIPSWITGLTALQDLGLENCGLTGEIPDDIGNLNNLDLLSLRINQLIGDLPPSIGSLTKLVNLRVDVNQLTGPIPDMRNLQQLQLLDLNRNELDGIIPEWLGSLGALKYIRIWNNNFTGPIPASLGNLGQLEQLHLGYCQLTGSIPEEIVQLPKLKYLYLNNNLLEGALPEVPATSLLRDVYLSNNKVSVPVLKSLPGITKLLVDNTWVSFAEIENNMPDAGTPQFSTFIYSPQQLVVAPVSRDYYVGQDLIVENDRAGGANTLYQWQKWNGSTWEDIVEASAMDLSLPAPGPEEDNQRYRCKMTNTVITDVELFSSEFILNAIVSKDFYTIADGNWDDPSIWSNISGGATVNNVPTRYDIVFIEGHDVKVSTEVSCLGMNINALQPGKVEVAGQAAYLIVNGEIVIEGPAEKGKKMLVVNNGGKIECR